MGTINSPISFSFFHHIAPYKQKTQKEERVPHAWDVTFNDTHTSMNCHLQAKSNSTQLKPTQKKYL
jgi:hypothetical protein